MIAFFLALQMLFLKEAVTPEQHTIGLMGEEHLADNEAMLFIFPDSAVRHFWSLGCLISLDVGFLDDELVLREVYTLQAVSYWQTQKPIRTLLDLKRALQKNPHAYKSISSTKPYRYAIELTEGWFVRHKVFPGYRLHKEGEKGYFSP